MKTWEQFEFDCTDYLNKTFGTHATFTHKGSEDSTVPDILVETKTGASFYIEAKHSPAQCGQFVLLPNLETQEFDYSPLNANHINSYAQKIMQHMNSDFDAYREAGTSGKDIIMPNDKDIFSDWVIDTYSRKNVRFFITNNYTILPIDRFNTYFDITAKYRIKRSGSSNVGKSNLLSVSHYIENNIEIRIDLLPSDDGKLFALCDKNIHDNRFILYGNEYMFSRRDDRYEVRRLSNTYNANVIFSVVNKANVSGLTDNEFTSFLK